MTNSTKLPTDSYYRGYRISQVWVTDHWVFKVYSGPDWVDSFLDIEDAKHDIDGWLNAA